MTDTDTDAIDRLDEMALRQCIEIYMAQGDSHRKHVDEMVADQGWLVAAMFCCCRAQYDALHLKPWQEPVCSVDEDDPNERSKDAQAMLRRMLAAGVSRFHPDPVAALEGEARTRFAKNWKAR
jgi:hypothetical protein